jgi:hypothetical protein
MIAWRDEILAIRKARRKIWIFGMEQED